MMKKIKMMVELSYNANFMHGKDKESTQCFYRDILKSKRKNDLILHSNEVGDQIGTVKVLHILPPNTTE